MSFRPAILPWCSHVNYVKKDAVRVCELFGNECPQIPSLDLQRLPTGVTKVLNPPLGYVL